ncbi:Uncharacterized protein TCM_032496 [Theobroma cacao]|uniref:Uncharacterized protein n=1 Tax=Theobroma cacao TaxID=3641 RepID=A0A061FH97_THECC|nr:Uncharacterized protein TCM_032496 [Theobroma cacao]
MIQNALLNHQSVLLNRKVLTHSTRVNDGVVTKRQLRRIMRRHKKDMLELKASIESLTLAMQIEHHDDADDVQHDEPGAHIHHDVINADGENVPHVDDVLNDVVATDVTLQLVDAEGDHVLEVDAVVEVVEGRDGNLASVHAKGDHISHSTPQSSASRVLSPELSDVHYREALNLNPTKRARVKMSSKYMANSYVDPLVSRRDLKNSMVEAYEAFKKDECARCNVGILGD